MDAKHIPRKGTSEDLHKWLIRKIEQGMDQ